MDATIPCVTQWSSSSDEEDQVPAPVPAPPTPVVSTIRGVATTTACQRSSQQPKPLVQLGLHGQKVKDPCKRAHVRQFSKKSGSKVRAHSRKTPSSRGHVGRKASPPSSSVVSLLHLDAADAKIINSIMIQDKLDACKARGLPKPKPK